jgi:hypothetical protein
MKIGILYIATGHYSCFWEGFYRSAEQYLFPDDEKHYFVFTDSPEIKGENVTVIHRECQGFPADSLFRFEMFLSAEEQLEKMDYLYFFNSNVVFTDKVAEELIPGEEHNCLLGAIHPMESVRKYPPLLFTYERNKESLAYIPPRQKGAYHYYMGGFNGGRTPEFLKLCRTLAENIRKDHEKGIIARFHDESHLNRYFRDFPPLTLGREYGVFEGWNLKKPGKLMFRDKLKVSSVFKKNKDSFFARILRLCRKIVSGITWYLFG